jgi:hypothetical protein
MATRADVHGVVQFGNRRSLAISVTYGQPNACVSSCMLQMYSLHCHSFFCSRAVTFALIFVGVHLCQVFEVMYTPDGGTTAAKRLV